MARIVLINAATASTSLTECNTAGYSVVAISADNLATTEEVDILVDGKAVTDTAGTAQKLTATIPILQLLGGIRYQLSKDTTAGACSVYLWTPGKVNN